MSNHQPQAAPAAAAASATQAPATTNEVQHGRCSSGRPANRHFDNANKAFDPVIDVLRATLEARMSTFYNDLLDGKYGGVKLSELEVCQHQDPNGDIAKNFAKNKVDGVKRSKLAKCPSCSPWLAAMGRAQVAGKVRDLSSSMYPFRWRNPSLGPYAIVKNFTQRCKAHTLAMADATCIINIVLRCKGTFPDLSTQDRANLEELRKGRNNLSHLHKKALTAEEKAESIAVCRAVLDSGPWTQDATLIERASREVDEWAADPCFISLPTTLLLITIAVCLVILGFTLWRMRINKLLPPLPQLEPHYIPQHQLLHNVTQALLVGNHRIAALSGLGGVGKSTTALALAWQLARSGTCPGRHGVLWGAAGSQSGGIAGALADVVRRQMGINLNNLEAADEPLVRGVLRDWAARRHDPWLLVLDNVEPLAREHTLRSLLGEHGMALITTRAGPNALYRDMGLPRSAVLRVECLTPEDGFALMVARYNGTSHAAAGLSASEEAAVRELAGADGLNGLPLAMEQVAALVGSTQGKTFVGYLAEYQEQRGQLPALPGDDGGRSSLAQVLTKAAEGSRLSDVPGLVDQVLAMCESLEDVQWMEARDIEWGKPGQAATPVQLRKWAAFKQRCEDQSVAAQQRHTVETVWATQLKVLPSYSVELLRLASSFAPDYIPQAVFAKALMTWMAADGDSAGWLRGIAGSSDLVTQAKRERDVQSLSGARAQAAASSVVEAALQWLEDYSLVRRGQWRSPGDIHPRLATGTLGVAVQGNTTTADCQGDCRDAGSTQTYGWFRVHRLVQGVVGSKAGSALGSHHVLASIQADLAVAAQLVQRICSGDLPADEVQPGARPDIVLAAWLVAHDHTPHVVQATMAGMRSVPSESQSDGGVGQLAMLVEMLSRLVPELDLHQSGQRWLEALEAMRPWATPAALRRVAMLYKHLSRYGEAEPLFLQALVAERQARGGGDKGDSKVVASLLSSLGDVYRSQTRYAEAEPLLVEAQSMWQRVTGGGQNREIAATVNSLGMVYAAQRRYEAAEPLLEQALAMSQQLAVGSHGDSSTVAASLASLAALRRSQRRYEEAEQLFVRALDMKRRLHGDSASSEEADSFADIALLLMDRGHYERAEAMYEQALQMKQRVHGDGDSSDVATAMINLANLYRVRERFDKAERLLVHGRSMWLRLQGDGDSSYAATILSNLADLYRAQGRNGEAEPLLQQAVAMRQRLAAGDRGTSDLASALTRLADLYMEQSRHEEAEPLLSQALELRQGPHGVVDSWATAQLLTNLGSVMNALGRESEASALQQQGLAMRERLG